jgi:hypothetical protein
LTLAATPFAAPLFPVVLVATWRERGVRAVLLLAGQAAAVVAALVAPFYLWAPREFVEGTLLWFGNLERFPRLRWTEARTWLEYPGLGGLFWTLGIERWLQPLQAALVVGLATWFARARAGVAAVPAFGVAIHLAFVLSNQVLWPYFYHPAIVAALCAAVTATGVRPEQTAGAGRHRGRAGRRRS